MNFSIDQREVGPGRPCFVIAEVAQAHDGSLGTAHAYIDAVAARRGRRGQVSNAHRRRGIDAGRAVSRQVLAPGRHALRLLEADGVQPRPSGKAWPTMRARRAWMFLSTPFSFEAAVELLERLGMPAWKVGSGEVTNLPMLEQMAATGRPVLLSSGMADWEELDRAVATVRECRAPRSRCCNARRPILARRRKSGST